PVSSRGAYSPGPKSAWELVRGATHPEQRRLVLSTTQPPPSRRNPCDPPDRGSARQFGEPHRASHTPTDGDRCGHAHHRPAKVDESVSLRLSGTVLLLWIGRHTLDAADRRHSAHGLWALVCVAWWRPRCTLSQSRRKRTHSMAQLQMTRSAKSTRLAQLYTQIAASAASAALGSGILVLLGFSPLPASFPLVTFARAHPVTALTLGTVLLGVLAAVLVVAQRARTLRPHAEAQVTRFVLFATLSAVGGALLSVVFGFSTLPTSIPLIDLIRTHTPLGISLLAVPLALMVCAPLFSLWGESPT